ncbi:MAG TPA: AAA family ATPase, partial [Stellaceae bacterium]|nr:AAA family ATPase [Stellaceae bacterium]
LLRHYEIDGGRLTQQLDQAIGRLKRGNARTPALAQSVLDWFEAAWVKTSLYLNEGAIRSGALLLALLDENQLRGLVLEGVPALALIPRGRFAEEVRDLIRGTAEDAPGRGAARAEASPRRGPSSTPALDAYTIDLTAEAAAGRIDPIIGRDHEIRQIIDVLMRRRQNNPILTGEAGVGKTAIVEGFAQRIVAGEVPAPLRAVKVRILDLGLLQAGAGIKGEFENRLKQVIDEVKSSPDPIVLFIDEAHTMIGAGGPPGQSDAANLLKPALARGELRTIAATTWAEYKRYFEKDPALARRFQVIKVDEPDEETAAAMLRGLVTKLEHHHGVRILDEAVSEAVRLSRRYIQGRQLPDKAVGLLDTAAARVAIAQECEPPALQDAIRRVATLNAEIALLGREKITGRDHAERIELLVDEAARSEERRQRLATRFEQERATVKRIAELQRGIEAAPPGKERARLLGVLGGVRLELEAIQEGEPMVPASVDGRTVAAVVSGWTGIPVGRMLTDRLQMVHTLKERMRERI